MRSATLLAFAATTAFAAAASADPVFREDFEHGADQWTAADSGPIEISSDTATCSTQYQHETVPYGGGRVWLASPITVSGASEYCVSAWIRGDAGSIPFVGLRELDTTGAVMSDHFVIGADGYNNNFGGQVVSVNSDGAWHWYAADITLDAGAGSILLNDELWSGGGGTFADFDDIEVNAGPCATQYGGVDQHAVCGGDTPYCSSDGSCSAPPAPSTGGGGGSTGTTGGSSGGTTGGDTGGSTGGSSGGGATPSSPSTGTTGTSTQGNQVGTVPPSAPAMDTPATPMDPPTQMHAVTMGGGCTMVRGVADEGLAMMLLCGAMLALLLRRSARR